MTKEELEKRINEIEWDDFEMKTAQNKLPNDVWETVSAFSNTSGVWIVIGVHQHGKKFDVVLMNPPYLGTNLGDNLYVDFLNKCLEISNILVIASLISDNFLIDFSLIRIDFINTSASIATCVRRTS